MLEPSVPPAPSQNSIALLFADDGVFVFPSFNIVAAPLVFWKIAAVTCASVFPSAPGPNLNKPAFVILTPLTQVIAASALIEPVTLKSICPHACCI